MGINFNNTAWQKEFINDEEKHILDKIQEKAINAYHEKLSRIETHRMKEKEI